MLTKTTGIIDGLCDKVNIYYVPMKKNSTSFRKGLECGGGVKILQF